MKAIAYIETGPADRPASFVEINLPRPELRPRDLLVRIKAVSVNVVDTKLRRGARPKDGEPRVLGFDAAGVVEAVGADVSLFAVGDEVFYAGEIGRAGSNAELQAVDERIVGKKPSSLTWSQAAAMPLTSLTAMELLFDRMKVSRQASDTPGTLLVIGGAGGVGSILIQIARQLNNLTVVATASRAETQAWCQQMGAHHVIDHREPLSAGMKALGLNQADYIACLTASEHYRDQMVELIAPQGGVGIIDGPKSFDVAPFLQKAVSVCGEGMFVRSLYRTRDMIEQHRLLNELSTMLDAGVLRSTWVEDAGQLSAEALAKVHLAVETGRTIGKITLTGL